MGCLKLTYERQSRTREKTFLSVEKTLGEKAFSYFLYEKDNHLGNVHVVVSDRKIPHQTSGTIDYFTADLLSALDYGSFGEELPGRSVNPTQSTYGFNGKRKDNEMYGEGNAYDYGFRIYNPRLGRFLSVDPLARNYPWYTPYQFAGNKPIWAIDVDGLEEYIYQYTLVNDKATLLQVIDNKEVYHAGGYGYGSTTIYDRRTGKPFNPKELGMVQYQYFDINGLPLNQHKSLNGKDYLDGAGEMMSLHQENFDGSIYISSPFGTDPKVNLEGEEDFNDYRREATDLADAAALEHDWNYDAVKAEGFSGMLSDETLDADLLLLERMDQIIRNSTDKNFKDPYTGKPISEQTLYRVNTIINVFTPVVHNKISNLKPSGKSKVTPKETTYLSKSVKVKNPNVIIKAGK